MSKRSPAVSAQTAKGLLGVLAFCAFLVGMDSMLVSTLIPAMTLTAHVPAHDGGLLVTMYALLYGLSAPLFGPVSDRLGRKPVLILGLFIFAVGTALTGFGNTFIAMLAFRAVSGLGGAVIMPTVFALIGDTIPYERRGQAMGVIMGALLSASVVGVPLGSFLAYGTTWRSPFWVVGVLAGIGVLVVLTKVPATPPPRTIPLTVWETYRRQFKTAFTQASVFFALLSSKRTPKIIGILGVFL